jgi:hypothetical protein
MQIRPLIDLNWPKAAAFSCLLPWDFNTGNIGLPDSTRSLFVFPKGPFRANSAILGVFFPLDGQIETKKIWECYVKPISLLFNKNKARTPGFDNEIFLPGVY